MTVFTTRNYLLALATLVASAITYYFAYALPEQNRMELELKREENTRATVNESQRTLRLESCKAASIVAADEYLRLNGTPVIDEPGVFRSSYDVSRKMEEIKHSGIEDCIKLYGK